MKRLIAISAAGLLLAACDAGIPDDVNVARVDETSASELPMPAEATPPAGEVSDELVVEDPLQAKAVNLTPWVHKLRLRLPWSQSSHEARREELEGLAARGSEWAQETLRKLDAGEIHPSELDDSAEKVAEERRNYPEPTSFIVPGGKSDGCAPMPFGSSMFGPWDTGSGTNP